MDEDGLVLTPTMEKLTSVMEEEGPGDVVEDVVRTLRFSLGKML